MSSQLAHFPMINQNHEPTADGQPDENAAHNCVPACLVACLAYYTGKTYDPDELKDAVYGQGKAGVDQNPATYAAYCHDRGVQIETVTGAPDLLISRAHREIAAGHAVLIAIPSQWNQTPPPDGGSSHVVAFYAEDTAQLTAMNPWGGFAQTAGDGWWAQRLRFGELWIVSAISAATPGVPAGWHDDGATLTAPNGTPVVLGFRAWVLAHNWAADNVPYRKEYYPDHLSYAEPINSPAGSRQDFTSCALLCDKATDAISEIALGEDFDALRNQVAVLNQTIQVLQARDGGPGASESIAALKGVFTALQALGLVK